MHTVCVTAPGDNSPGVPRLSQGRRKQEIRSKYQNGSRVLRNVPVHWSETFSGKELKTRQNIKWSDSGRHQCKI